MRSPAVRAGAATLLFAALAAVLFPRALTGQGAFFHYDTWMQNLPFRAWWFDQLRSGHFATWCPGMFAGFPLFAEGQTGALYPPGFLLFLLLPATLAFSVSVLLHFALAGAGACFLARRLGAGWSGAVLAGVTYELSGFLVTHVVHFNLLVGAAWAPWAIAFAHEAWQGRPRGALLLAATTALLLLGAHPYAALMTLLMLGVALVLRSGLRPGPLGRGAALLAGAVLLGAALAAVQVLPTGELLARTPRGDAVDWSFLTFGSFPPWHVATLAAPDLFGTPVDGSYHAGPDWSHFAETCAYAGLAALGLAAAALAMRRDAGTFFLGAGTALSLLLMLGRYTPVYRVLGWIPLLQSTRLPARFGLLFTVGVAVLAGLGLDALRRGEADRRRRGVAAAAITMLALAAAAWMTGAEARAPEAWIAETGRMWPATMRAITESAQQVTARLAIVLLAGLAALVPFALRRVPAWAPALPAGVIAVDLLTWGASFNPTIPPSWLTDPPPAVAALPQGESRPRVFRQGVDELWMRPPGAARTDLFTPAWKGNESSYRSGAWTLTPNCQLLYGVDSGEGFTSLLPSQWLEWMGLDGGPGAAPRPDLSQAQADLLAIDAVISTGAGIAGEGWETVPSPGDVWVSRNADPLPRVRLARSWETVADRRALIARVRDPAHDPRRGVLLESAPPGLPPGAAGGPVDEALPARELGPGHWEIDVPSGANGLVVLAESFDPDWTARDASGRTLPVFRADGLFAAFAAPERGGSVVLRHAPSSVRLGAVVSLGALVALAALAFAVRGRSLRALAEPEPARGAARNAVPWVVAALVVAVSAALDTGGWRADHAATGLRGAAARAWTEEAFAARRAGALQPAAELLRAANRARPDDPAGHYRLGLVERDRGRETEARAAFEKALALDPGFGAAREALEGPPPDDGANSLGANGVVR